MTVIVVTASLPSRLQVPRSVLAKHATWNRLQALAQSVQRGLVTIHQVRSFEYSTPLKSLLLPTIDTFDHVMLGMNSSSGDGAITCDRGRDHGPQLLQCAPQVRFVGIQWFLSVIWLVRHQGCLDPLSHAFTAIALLLCERLRSPCL